MHRQKRIAKEIDLISRASNFYIATNFYVRQFHNNNNNNNRAHKNWQITALPLEGMQFVKINV